jgi:integrase
MHLELDELKAILRQIRKPRSRQMVLTSFWHGLRASEACGPTGLKGKHIQDGHVWVKRLKGSDTTIQPFQTSEDPELDESPGLIALAQTVGPNEYVFPMTRFGFYYIMVSAGQRAGIPGFKEVRPHILKHSICSLNIHTSGIENVRRWVGHKSIASTGQYLKRTDAEAAAAIGQSMRSAVAVSIAGAKLAGTGTTGTTGTTAGMSKIDHNLLYSGSQRA